MQSGRALAAGLVFLVVGPVVGVLTFLAVFYVPAVFGDPLDSIIGWEWIAIPLGTLLAPVAAGVCCAGLLRHFRLPMAAVPGVAFAASYFALGMIANFLLIGMYRIS